MGKGLVIVFAAVLLFLCGLLGDCAHPQAGLRPSLREPPRAPTGPARIAVGERALRTNQSRS